MFNNNNQVTPISRDRIIEVLNQQISNQAVTSKELDNVVYETLINLVGAGTQLPTSEIYQLSDMNLVLTDLNSLQLTEAIKVNYILTVQTEINMMTIITTGVYNPIEKLFYIHQVM